MEQMRIRVQTEVLEMRANSAEQKIRAVKNRFDQIAKTVSASRNYWEGDAANAHRREYQEYQEEIEGALARFQENVDDLRRIAGIYRESEAQNADLAGDLPADVLI